MNAKTQFKGIKHPFEPIFDKNSRVLILGSFPPKNSIENGFYYSSGNNRLWGILDRLFNGRKLIDLAKHSKDEKIAFLKAHKIALYDIWGVCYKENPESSDDKDIIAEKSQRADLSEILKTAKIQKIVTTLGGKFKEWGVEAWLWETYSKYFPHCKNASQMIVPLCSTSGATGRSYEDLIKNYGYKQIAEFVK